LLVPSQENIIRMLWVSVLTLDSISMILLVFGTFLTVCFFLDFNFNTMLCAVILKTGT
jgi:hypothetical protein